MAKQSLFNRIKNFFIVPRMDINMTRSNSAFKMSAGGSDDSIVNLSNNIIPTQFKRDIIDLTYWKDAIGEAEQLPYPYRVKMQEIFIQAVTDAQVYACYTKRKNLNLLRQYIMVDENGERNEEWTNYIQADWFKTYISFVLDAIFYGYTLISIGDIVDNNLPKLTFVRRWNVSPDREQVSTTTYVPAGTPFLEKPWSDWHIWVKTPTDQGVSGCGYGLLYPVSYCYINLKDNMTYNMTYNELFGSPLKVLKTDYNNETERANEAYMLSMIGNSAGLVIKKDDELEFVEAKSGAGGKVYQPVNEFMHKNISKLILGHADAIDSIPGKLGNTNAESAAGEALEQIQEADNAFLMPYIECLFDKLRLHGVNIPINLTCKALNSEEESEIQEKRNKNAKEVADVVKILYDAGFKVGKDFIEQETLFVIDEEVVEPKEDKNDNSGINI